MPTAACGICLSMLLAESKFRSSMQNAAQKATSGYQLVLAWSNNAVLLLQRVRLFVTW